MKPGFLAILAATAATPAFAHVEGAFHTHGLESILVLALAAGVAALVALRR
ncbi:hypothetical protein N6L24_09370 [Cognatishimia sp. SS12]|uniref:hypothetical protein n=1 Tax=Cognatishimia sp. SS12 TaxID=2979465 RepID=UPI00232E3C40|nr:hypothetical protein [Cognatishimia sp. SS12]MDC0738491.1 hypothetical protein [Cognatishimia sp. SS12]